MELEAKTNRQVQAGQVLDGKGVRRGWLMLSASCYPAAAVVGEADVAPLVRVVVDVVDFVDVVDVVVRRIHV